MPASWRTLLLPVLLVGQIATASDTGPEYLEGEEEQDPLGIGFLLFQLPFEEERDHHLHVRSFYQNRDFDGAPDREDWALGGSLGAVGNYWDSRFKIAVTGYTSQKLYADKDKADTGALQGMGTTATVCSARLTPA